ncbi:hypothetical protein NXS19_004512 [Fusarium pseudograminearum]|nr:hypothetical protein NXS19_004512 [Fusarium pseudograminearum]
MVNRRDKLMRNVFVDSASEDVYKLVYREQRASRQLIRIHTVIVESLDEVMKRAKERDRLLTSKKVSALRCSRHETSWNISERNG